MSHATRLTLLVLAVLAACGGEHAAPAPSLGSSAQALGEPNGGYPNDGERVFHYLTDRARLEPTNTAVCGQGFSVPVTKPLEWNLNLNHSARYHSREMGLAPCFQHPSCGFLIGTGLNTCASALPPEKGGTCTPGSDTFCTGYDPMAKVCNAKCPQDARLDTFGRFTAMGYTGSYKGENIAAGQPDAREAFCDFFLEGPDSMPSDGQEHGHFLNIVSKDFNEVGHGEVVTPTASGGCGSYKRYYTQDFGGRSGLVLSSIPAASHWRKPGASAETFGAIWNASAAPTTISVVIDGSCTPLALAAGTAASGAYEATVALASGCHAYYFVAQPQNGAELTYPTNGSLLLGTGCTGDYEVARTPGNCGGGTCTPGLACFNPDGCMKGVIDCGSGQPVCGAYVNVADGTACGGGKTCQGGACGGCTPGGSCTSADGCRTGTLTCGPSGATCGNFTDKPDGTACGGGMVCGSGTCGGCRASGAPCYDATGCNSGTMGCTNGVAACKLTKTEPNGTACGQNAVCFDGACVTCPHGASCPDPAGDPCKRGVTSCASGKAVCVNVAVVAEGTACANGGTCLRGSCIAPDGGTAIVPDAGAADAGEPAVEGSCGCGAADAPVSLFGTLALAALVRRRRS